MNPKRLVARVKETSGPTTYYVVHPEPKLSEKVKIQISDVPNQNAFEARWEKESNRVQQEFNYDSPLWEDEGETPHWTLPKKTVKMTYKDYIALINDYTSKTDGTVDFTGSYEAWEKAVKKIYPKAEITRLDKKRAFATNKAEVVANWNANKPGWIKQNEVARLKETAVSREEQAFYEWLTAQWSGLADDIHPHVKSNRQAVEHLVDLSFGKMDKNQKVLCRDLGIQKIAFNVNVY